MCNFTFSNNWQFKASHEIALYIVIKMFEIQTRKPSVISIQMHTNDPILTIQGVTQRNKPKLYAPVAWTRTCCLYSIENKHKIT